MQIRLIDFLEGVGLLGNDLSLGLRAVRDWMIPEQLLLDGNSEIHLMDGLLRCLMCFAFELFLELFLTDKH